MSIRTSIVPSVVSVLALLLVLLMGAPSAKAQCGGGCPIIGNARIQNGLLPVPITGAPVPFGPIIATPLASVMTAGVVPQSVFFAGGDLTKGAAPFTLPVFAANPMVFQVMTSISASVPGPFGGTLSASGRTGAPVVSFCPGQVVLPLGNPACATPNAGPGAHGRLRYTKTLNQFGGAARPFLGGSANVALAGAAAPCAGPACTFAIVKNTPPGTLAIGGSFATVMHPGAPNAPGNFSGTVTAGGLILNAVPTVLLNPFPASPLTSYGGPWTTGMLTVSVTMPAVSIFVLSGSDARSPAGAGNLSLVAGSISVRTMGSRAGSAWLNLAVPEPGAVVGLTGALLALALCHHLVQWKPRRSKPRTRTATGA